MALDFSSEKIWYAGFGLKAMENERSRIKSRQYFIVKSFDELRKKYDGKKIPNPSKSLCLITYVMHVFFRSVENLNYWRDY